MVYNPLTHCDHPFICNYTCVRYNNSGFVEGREDYNAIPGVVRQDIVFMVARLKDYFNHTDIIYKYRAISDSVGIGFKNFT